MTDMTPETKRRELSPRLKIAAAAIGLLAVGGGAGVVTAQALKPAVEMAPVRPVAIKTLSDGDSIVTVKGRVAEVYGNKFVIDDGSAKALVDTGRAGDGTALVAPGAAVTVQGRFDRGFVHASFLVDGSGHVTSLAPPPPPHRGPPHGDRHGPGPDDRGPPPPPPAGAAAPAGVATPPTR